MRYDIGVIGDCVQDIFISSEAQLLKKCGSNNKIQKYLSYPYGDKIGIDALHHDLGGSACNAAVGIRRLGLPTQLLSAVGDDLYSRNAIVELKKKKVGTRFIRRESSKPLDLSFILLGPDRDRSILTYRPKHDFSAIPIYKFLKRSRSYYVAGINKYSKVLQRDIIDFAVKYKKEVYINPSGYQIEKDLAVLKRILKHTTVATMNVEEAQKILGFRKTERDIKRLLRGIKKLGVKTVAITDSKKGSYAYDGKHFFKAGIYPFERIDTTGGGDSFCATFVVAQKKGYSIEDSLHLAAINSGSVVSQYGAQKGLLNWNQVVALYNKHKVRVRKF